MDRCMFARLCLSIIMRVYHEKKHTYIHTICSHNYKSPWLLKNMVQDLASYGKPAVRTREKAVMWSVHVYAVMGIWVLTLCQCRCAQPLWTCSRRRGTVVSAYSVSGSQSNILWKHCSSFPAMERKETYARRGSETSWEHGDDINCNGRLNRRIKQIRNKKPEMNSRARGGLERRNSHAFYISSEEVNVNISWLMYVIGLSAF